MALHSRLAVAAALVLALMPAAAHAADIQGRILYDGPAPAREELAVDPSKKGACGPVYSEKLLVSPEGGVKNAVVSLEGEFPAAPPASKKALLDQQNCRFEPHVAVVPAGQGLEILNSDPQWHDVRAFLGTEMIFRHDLDGGAKPVTQGIDKPGVYVVRCGIHRWMHAYLIGAAHAYFAVTDENGRFIIKNVPPGRARLRVWHESLGEGALDAGPAEAVYRFKA